MGFGTIIALNLTMIAYILVSIMYLKYV